MNKNDFFSSLLFLIIDHDRDSTWEKVESLEPPSNHVQLICSLSPTTEGSCDYSADGALVHVGFSACCSPSFSWQHTTEESCLKSRQSSRRNMAGEWDKSQDSSDHHRLRASVCGSAQTRVGPLWNGTTEENTSALPRLPSVSLSQLVPNRKENQSRSL